MILKGSFQSQPSQLQEDLGHKLFSFQAGLGLIPPALALLQSMGKVADSQRLLDTCRVSLRGMNVSCM